MGTNTTEFGRLTVTMRDILIEHVDGASPIRVRGLSTNYRRAQRALIRRKFLIVHPPSHLVIRPIETRITEAGRQALAALLADYADALVRAQVIRDLMPAMTESAPKPEPAAPAGVAKLPQTSNA